MKTHISTALTFFFMGIAPIVRQEDNLSRVPPNKKYCGCCGYSFNAKGSLDWYPSSISNKKKTKWFLNLPSIRFSVNNQNKKRTETP